MNKLLFIFNPFSGKANVKNHLFEITDSLTKAGHLVTVYPTQKSNDCREYIREHGSEYQSIVVSGGDGTLNEAVAGLMDLEAQTGISTADIPLGYIPSGSTNDFAASLRIPKTISGAIKNIVDGKAFKCDVGLFNERPFNYVAAFGIFTEVSYATPQDLKNTLGHQAYILEGLKSFSNQKSFTMTVKLDGEEFTDTYIYGMVTNSKQVGGIKNITGKDVELNDGLFEVVLVKEPKNPIQLQEAFNGLVKPEDNGTVRHFKTNKVTFYCEEEVAWVLDGEFGGNNRLANIDVIKEKISYIVGKE